MVSKICFFKSIENFTLLLLLSFLFPLFLVTSWWLLVNSLFCFSESKMDKISPLT
jgi:hypothetical protein